MIVSIKAPEACDCGSNDFILMVRSEQGIIRSHWECNYCGHSYPVLYDGMEASVKDGDLKLQIGLKSSSDHSFGYLNVEEERELRDLLNLTLNANAIRRPS